MANGFGSSKQQRISNREMLYYSRLLLMFFIKMNFECNLLLCSSRLLVYMHTVKILLKYLLEFDYRENKTFIERFCVCYIFYYAININ